jgi:hypothetical protein
MRAGFPPLSVRGTRTARFLALVLALACQIGFGAVAQPDGGAARDLVALDAAMVFCHAGHAKGSDDTPPLRHDLADAALVAASLASADSVAVLGAALCLPTPPCRAIGRTDIAQARGPPARYASSTYPRGPPGPV